MLNHHIGTNSTNWMSIIPRLEYNRVLAYIVQLGVAGHLLITTIMPSLTFIVESTKCTWTGYICSSSAFPAQIQTNDPISSNA